MYDPSEELLDRLASPDVTVEDVLEHLWGQHNALFEENQPSPPVSSFFTGQADLDSYRQALDWWPKFEGVPPQHAPPSLFQLCWNYHETRFGSTFLERLTDRATPVVKWLEENGHSVNTPEESAEDRKRRLNNDAQRRFRSRKEGTPEAAHAQAIADAYQVYLDVCRMRKEAMTLWAHKVADARDAWTKLKAVTHENGQE